MSAAAEAFIAFLRCEALQSEARAKQLRATAAAIETNAERSRTSRIKKSVAGAKPKRSHTGYTLFVLENFDTFKNAHAAGAEGGDAVMASRDVLVTLARHWNQVDEAEKRAWQDKAKMLAAAEEAATDVANNSAAAVLPPDAFEELGLPEPPNEDWGNKKRPARKDPPKQQDEEAEEEEEEEDLDAAGAVHV